MKAGRWSTCSGCLPPTMQRRFNVHASGRTAPSLQQTPRAWPSPRLPQSPPAARPHTRGYASKQCPHTSILQPNAPAPVRQQLEGEGRRNLVGDVGHADVKVGQVGLQ